MKSKHFVIAGVITLLVAAAFWMFRAQPFAVLDAGGGYSFRFYSHRAGFLDDMPTHYNMLDYELVHDGRTIFREAFTSTATPPATLEFQLVTSPAHRVVAVVERTAPDIVFLVYDLDSGESSRQGFNETRTPAIERANRLLARLQRSVQQTLVMRDQAKLGPERVTRL